MSLSVPLPQDPPPPLHTRHPLPLPLPPQIHPGRGIPAIVQLHSPNRISSSGWQPVQDVTRTRVSPERVNPHLMRRRKSSFRFKMRRDTGSPPAPSGPGQPDPDAGGAPADPPTKRRVSISLLPALDSALPASRSMQELPTIPKPMPKDLRKSQSAMTLTVETRDAVVTRQRPPAQDRALAQRRGPRTAQVGAEPLGWVSQEAPPLPGKEGEPSESRPGSSSSSSNLHAGAVARAPPPVPAPVVLSGRCMELPRDVLQGQGG